MYPSRKRNRAGWHDYSDVGWYFVTVCTRFHTEWFGEVRDGVMNKSDAGTVATNMWFDIPNHFDHVELDEFIVMPNHIHGVIVIRSSGVGNRHACSLHEGKRQHQKLPVIIGSYKSAVAKQTRLLPGHKEFTWQKSYHDRIIRSQKQLQAIQMYIHTNPRNWEENVYYS